MRCWKASAFRVRRGLTVFTEDEAVAAAEKLGYPVLVRPSYVLGGQGMEIAYEEKNVREYMRIIGRAKQEHPILIDKYMVGKELEVDAVCDGEDIRFPESWSTSNGRASTRATAFPYIRRFRFRSRGSARSQT